MIQITSHVPHTPLGRGAEKPAADHGPGQDFLDHLRGGKPAVRQGGHPATDDAPDRAPSGQADDGRRIAEAPLQVADPSDGPAPVSELTAATAETSRANLQCQATRHTPIAVGEAATRARVFEQHWFANGYLSFLAGAGEACASSRRVGMRDMPGQSMAAATTTPEAPTPSEPTPTEVSMSAWPVALEGQASATGALPRSIERMVRTLGPLLAADQPWPDRLLRLSQQRDGKTAVWVRDYKLTPKAIEPLVAHLRQLARREGIALGRVVVNGTIVWHSESLKGEA